MVSISVRPERYSHQLIKESGEFVINLPTESLVRALDWCGVKSGRDVDNFSDMYLTPAPAAKVGTVLVEERPVNLECKVTQVIPLGSRDLLWLKSLPGKGARDEPEDHVHPMPDGVRHERRVR